ncbi:hypothetical protein MSLAZ_1966 [Methanosarcina lacustris Z-7289]|uniref:Uncharacterized protein n=1 Tax=Methanosarcina lacustris Z-7289 TaxID=1434111 RepID=A0A0E3S765_9EURY|nr:tetratricopeptide repeat protein [Methanosarcina lacustris]AKB75227.1 hypothetical protein MSLAZ_1966 [Methanosarcina lacustris Z-7289]
MKGLDSEYNILIPELREHCNAALRSFGNLDSSGDRDLRISLKEFFTSCSRISILLWSKNNKKQRKHLRSIFSIADNSPISPRSISELETVSGRIEKPLEDKGMKSALQETAVFSYDPETKTLTVDGKQYEILPIFLAVRDLYASLPFFDELQTCTEMLEKDPQNATALFQKALLIYKTGRFEAALQLTEQVLEIVPDDFRVWYNRGVILSEMGRLEEAIDAYDRVIELEPAFEIAWDNKGVVLARLGRLRDALETYEKVLRRNPKYAEAWAGKGAILSALDRKEEALEAYSSALKIRHDYMEALKCISSLFSRMGRFEEALAAYDTALQSAPEDPSLWAGKGLVLSELNKQEEALQSCSKALELKPGFVPALEIKVEILLRISRQKVKDSR